MAASDLNKAIAAANHDAYRREYGLKPQVNECPILYKGILMEILKASDFIDDNNIQLVSDKLLAEKFNQIAFVFYHIFQSVADGYGVFDSLEQIDLNDEELLSKRLHGEFVALYKASNEMLRPLFNLRLSDWVSWMLTFANESLAIKSDEIQDYPIDPDHLIYITSFHSIMRYFIKIGLLPSNLSNFKIITDNPKDFNKASYTSFVATLETPDIGNIKDIFGQNTELAKSPIYPLTRLVVANILFTLGNNLSPKELEVASLTDGIDYYTVSSIILSVNLVMFLYVLGFLDPIVIRDINKLYNTIKPQTVLTCVALNDELISIAEDQRA